MSRSSCLIWKYIGWLEISHFFHDENNSYVQHTSPCLTAAPLEHNWVRTYWIRQDTPEQAYLYLQVINKNPGSIWMLYVFWDRFLFCFSSVLRDFQVKRYGITSWNPAGVANLKMNDVQAELIARSKTVLPGMLFCKICLTNTEDLMSDDFSTNNKHNLQEVARVLFALNKLGRPMQKKFILCSSNPGISLISTGPWTYSLFAASWKGTFCTKLLESLILELRFPRTLPPYTEFQAWLMNFPTCQVWALLAEQYRSWALPSALSPQGEWPKQRPAHSCWAHAHIRPRALGMAPSWLALPAACAPVEHMFSRQVHQPSLF